ncbi:DUF4402 domain-containing protein [Sediminicola sp. 1XM1-17]|uniref:DUF4402 domain-containing protein n=1 Tax=Sediminicola sp. 1XM1-17 TaxID=3127702 RepID=UPI003076D28A
MRCNTLMKIRVKGILIKLKALVLSNWILCILLTSSLNAQIIGVETIQNFSFGMLTQQGSGGTLIMDSTGTITNTGNVYHLESYAPYHTALIDIEAYSGTNISIINQGPSTLTGSNGGSITFEIGETDPHIPFVVNTVSPNKTRLRLGGTLTVQDNVNSPPGTYSGSFLITFNYE